MKSYVNIDRRRFLKRAWPLSLLIAAPALAIDIFKVIDPEGKSKDIKRAKQVLKGSGNILASTKELDYKSEFAIGESLALEGFKRYGLPLKKPYLQGYVNLVGNAVARNSSRSKIPYYFVVVESPLYNAFACPGGMIFISSTLCKSLNNEAELACILAHEVGHVTHKHALQSIKRAKFFEGVGQISTANMKGKEGEKYRNMIGNLQTVLFDKGLDKNMEFEADITGMEIAYRTGYRPDSFIRVLRMLQKNEKTAHKKGSWYSTHPPLKDRIQNCKQKMAHYPDASSLSKVAGRFGKFKKAL